MPTDLTITTLDATVHVTLTDETGEHHLRLSASTAAALGGLLISAAHIELEHPIVFRGESLPAPGPEAPSAPTEPPAPEPSPDTAHSPASADHDQAPDADPVSTASPEVAPAPQDDGPLTDEQLNLSNGISVPAAYQHLIQDESPSADWHISKSAEANGRAEGITADQMIAAAQSPDRVQPSQKPGVNAHLRGDISVLVPDDGGLFIIGCRREQHRAPTQVVRIRRAPSGGPGRSVPTNTAELHKALAAHGFTVTHGNATSHAKVTHPSRPGHAYTIGGTPSDSRTFLNVVAGIRRSFDIDITRAP